MKLPKLTKQQTIASAIIVALAFAFALGVYAFRGAIFLDNEEVVVIPNVPQAQAAFRHPLTGEKQEVESIGPYQVFAVMIDHAADAWPQSGVDDAFLVIEAPVEAGIPRLQAFFYEGQDVAKIGPVRSARPYFVDWANEFDAMYVHVGGSNAALELIGSNGTFDMNQFWNGDTFWRSSDRFAPHNTYTSTDLLGEALEAARDSDRAPDVLYGTWLFQDGVEQPPAEGIEPIIAFGASSYRAQWTYDTKTNRYKRLQGGLSFTMQEGDQIFANNIAVAVMENRIVDAVGRREIDTIGEGGAHVFQDGTVIEGTWKKPSVSERLRFYDATGKEIPMNAGKTWIEVIPDVEMLQFETPDTQE